MTTQELRELDAWIAEHVMDCKEAEVLRDLIDGRFIRNTEGEILIWRGRPNHPKVEQWRPTTNQSGAMDVLKKCAEKRVIIELFINVQGKWTCGTQSVEMGSYQSVFSESETAELSICLFAKQLFSQTTK